MEPSPSAELMLLSVDPAGGGWLVGRRGRRRLRKAIRLAGGSWRGAWSELRSAELVTGSRRRPRLTDRGPAGRRFRALQERMAADGLSEPRDVDVFVALAWSGVLAQRLPRGERRVAARRLRVLRQQHAGPAVTTMSPIVVALLLTGGGAPEAFHPDWWGDSALELGGSGFDGGGGGGSFDASAGAGGDGSP